MAVGCTTETETGLATLTSHLYLLDATGETKYGNEVAGAPIFTETVRLLGDSLPQNPFTQYGLLGGDLSRMTPRLKAAAVLASPKCDPRVFHNITAPSSVFICGSQGSGKSHTLSCLLENYLFTSQANVLPRPLTGIVFHYDTFISETGGSPCEAAYLASNSGVKVRVLCPPTNIGQIRQIYSSLPGVTVEELRIDESDFNTQRMLDLMAVSSSNGGGMPLYLHVVMRILRDLRIAQQAANAGFSYAAFKSKLKAAQLTAGQMNPLQQRLETLESFMVPKQVPKEAATDKKKKKKKSKKKNKKADEEEAMKVAEEKDEEKIRGTVRGTDWAPVAGQLTIVDLSCPCVTAEAACALFNMCLNLFLEQDSRIGRVICLDEAHKYMTNTTECATLTESLLATIRLQRHLGTRVVISTQEPTISPKLLDLCSVTIVHRFTSPDWLLSLRKHLAGATILNQGADARRNQDEDSAASAELDDVGMEMFAKIVALRTGEALMFAPSAAIDVAGRRVKRRKQGGPAPELVRLGHGVMKIRVRQRVTQDGGRSIMAT